MGTKVLKGGKIEASVPKRGITVPRSNTEGMISGIKLPRGNSKYICYIHHQEHLTFD
ncbi:hypothetical protein UFOVP1437_52 [uncultured Caudovirales phage]|uniref:Uncharacterized protein n=1 Tax=uncultured Caudovirales phage TaxID=2100421 RepID=A0A6J7XB48_9CAUD|nr:hypothetical protein UFOVP1437_52 [uncultured Caudovirales phage]CAB5228119.1 hypothetical protein UFOVP1531_13 [uncultured Caudovirales phage]